MGSNLIYKDDEDHLSSNSSNQLFQNFSELVHVGKMKCFHIKCQMACHLPIYNKDNLCALTNIRSEGAVIEHKIKATTDLMFPSSYKLQTISTSKIYEECLKSVHWNQNFKKLAE